MTVQAEVILASRNLDDRNERRILATLRVTMPRIILAEFNTHRAFSRNASSSRAIPVEKMIVQVQTNPFIPTHWGLNQKGMQADQECDELVCVDPGHDYIDRESAWLHARDRAVEIAQGFVAAGYHKQLVNRLLEPWMWTTVVVSATEWNNFFDQRCHPDAEPHMRMVAEAMRDALAGAQVQALHPGQWHLPFAGVGARPEGDYYDPAKLIKLSVARCASTSYFTVDQKVMTFERAIELHDKLVSMKPGHWSPTEHVARADDWFEAYGGSWLHPHTHRNFVGWTQYRSLIGG